MATPTPIARLLGDDRFAVLAATLLTLPYWTSGTAKLTDLPGALSEARHFGLEPAILTVAATILVQIGGSLLIILGRQAWLGAGALGVFTAIATLIAHPFWQVSDPMARFHERNTFLEHLGLIGGLMLAAILRDRKG
ncbi:DoxX family protein [Sphingomonas koreensis]|uniref:DoxX family protein n=1 Tax=Sphingomonas koreensis TaxID=93064 RepID=UPI0008378615|nr:DoxX family protein [Sphingomonas koreensis]PJI90567.1 putative membrane protein YphA (DoxX/SURF4 family) [Sphingomonas koreensis]RSU59066.1 DoxX family protein [Sphingomonas koreensis]RSU67619.1 DoxX family protein [Sphingomonas koreensis]